MEIRGEERKSKLFWTAERTFKVTDSLNVPNFESKVCYITVNLDFDDIHLLDGNTLTTNEVNELPLSRVILDAEFAEGYYYTTYRKALTDEAFDYFSKVKRVVERTGSMFESPVGLLPTNLSNADDPKDTDVYGYFTAYQQDTFRLYVSPESVGNPSKFCPPIIVFCPNICCNCLSELGSQIIKPDFWIE